jgi:hypothetical protein
MGVIGEVFSIPGNKKRRHQTDASRIFIFHVIQKGKHKGER